MVQEKDSVQKDVVVEDQAVMKPTEEKRRGKGGRTFPSMTREKMLVLPEQKVPVCQWLAGFGTLNLNPETTLMRKEKIVYRIKVDNDGYLINIELVQSTVSPFVERRYRNAIEKLSFSKTSEYEAAAVSTGKITFIIQAK